MWSDNDIFFIIKEAGWFSNSLLDLPKNSRNDYFNTNFNLVKKSFYDFSFNI